MSRTLFGPGAKGFLVRQIQQGLSQAGFDPHGIDEDYGNNTTAAVLKYQQSCNASAKQSRVPENGVVDDLTWGMLLACPIPSTWQRALQVTASFEGHGFTTAAGNFDGAWLTWGIIGFTMKYGEVQKIIGAVNSAAPQCVAGAFGDNAQELLKIIAANDKDQIAWANSISDPQNKRRLIEPWHSAFNRFGTYPEVQQVQLDRAFKRYFVPAIQTARAQGLKSELGLALAFDIHVQNGGIGKDAQHVIDQKKAVTPPANEAALRTIVANAVADSANPTWAADVRNRKLTFATGRGNVHQRDYVLQAWGLGDFDAPELVAAATSVAGNP